MGLTNFKARPAPAASTTLETITPETAAQYLEKNVANRSLSSPHVKRLAGAISRGEWEINGDSVRFDIDGNLIDGQHRLNAIIMAGESVQTLIVRGLPRTAFATIDESKPRRGNDVLSVGHTRQPTTTAAVLRLIAASGGYNPDWNGVIDSSASRMSNKQMLENMDQYPEAEVYADLIYSGDRKYCRRIMTPSLGAFAMCWFSRISEEEAVKFFDEIEYGENLTRHHPSNTLRTRLADLAMGGSKDRTSKREVLGMLFQAWNKRRAGKEMRLARFISSHKFPTPR